VAAPICALVLLLALASSCSESTRPGPGGDPGLIQESLLPVEGRVRFRIADGFESHSLEGEPRIYLSMQTEKIYPCCNYWLETAVAVLGEEVRVAITGVYVPEICLTALGPAGSRTELPLAPGRYRLIFTVGSRSESYVLTVSTSSLDVGGVAGTVVVPEITRAWRYPPRSFVYVCGTMEATSWIERDLADSILAVPGVREFWFPTGGETPYPTASGGHWVDHPARYYLYDGEADFDAVGTMFRRYSERVIRPSAGVSAYLMNWRNRWYRSWMVES
jgi:hypothetical protein